MLKDNAHWNNPSNENDLKYSIQNDMFYYDALIFK
jgi:hypothetical protein